MKGTLRHLHGNYFKYWSRHVATSRPILEQAFSASLDVGDLVFACYSCGDRIWHAVESGEPLDKIIEDARQGAAFSKQNNNPAIYEIICLERQFASTLQGSAPDAKSFDGNGFTESECLAIFNQVGYRTGVAHPGPLYPEASPDEQQKYASALEEKVSKLRQWADGCPDGYLNRYALASAEVARIQCRDLDARRLDRRW